MALALALALTLSAFSGCSGELDPRDPSDAYLMFRDALGEGDSQKVWARVDEHTRAYFERSYLDLQDMGDSIERYLPQSDHRLARSQSGVKLLDEVSDGRTLFLRVLTPEALPLQEDEYKLGSDIAELSLNEEETRAKVVTKGGQTFLLTRDPSDEQWYVMFTRSSTELLSAMRWVEDNKLALSQTVDDLIAEERAKREQVISELMHY